MGDVVVLGAAEEQQLLTEINKVRAAKRLKPVKLFDGFHGLAEKHAISVAGKKAGMTDGFQTRSKKVFAAGHHGYQEGAGQQTFSADAAGVSECIRTAIRNHTKDMCDPKTQAVGAVIVRSKTDYTWLIGFMK